MSISFSVPPGKFGDEAASDCWREKRIARCDDSHGIEQPLGVDVLQQKTAGTGAESVVDVQPRYSVRTAIRTSLTRLCVPGRPSRRAASPRRSFLEETNENQNSRNDDAEYRGIRPPNPASCGVCHPWHAAHLDDLF